LEDQIRPAAARLALNRQHYNSNRTTGKWQLATALLTTAGQNKFRKST